MTDQPPRQAKQSERDARTWNKSIQQRRAAVRERDVLLDAIALAMVRFVTEAIEPLKQRIAALEARPELRYAGTWKEGQSYLPGALTTDAGSLWLCTQATNNRPPSDHWKLVVKRGDISRDSDGRRRV